MKPCDTYQESLWLDAHGELAEEARIDLAGHLASCPGCRHEQRALRHLIQQAAAVHPPPALTAAESERLTENILSVLEAKHVRTPWRLPSFFTPSPGWVRMAAGACMIAAVILGLRVGFRVDFRAFQETDVPFQTAAVPNQEERILIEDLEVIENLDLLEELDDLEKLVRMTDAPVNGEFPTDRKGTTDKDRVSGEMEGRHAA
ncbi:zf-HC2 domain-containing protein [Desulfococcus sp.]|uniref:zf-HC2 domain-containing protein n=1 Tax=Desulfococcus sp. TaxID=2025834 RepID=UPI003593BBEC